MQSTFLTNRPVTTADSWNAALLPGINCTTTDSCWKILSCFFQHTEVQTFLSILNDFVWGRQCLTGHLEYKALHWPQPETTLVRWMCSTITESCARMCWYLSGSDLNPRGPISLTQDTQRRLLESTENEDVPWDRDEASFQGQVQPGQPWCSLCSTPPFKWARFIRKGWSGNW